jgi:hypothetical protein
MLHDPARHEPLGDAPWDEGIARAWIERFAADAQRAFTPEGLWPVHPRDADADDPGRPFTMMYLGAAGVIWALDRLEQVGAVAPSINFAPLLEDLAARNLALVEPWGHGVHGLLMGQTGILLQQYRLAADRATADAVADRIAAEVVANANHPALELLWGSPSTMHVALTMHEWTGDARWAGLFRADAEALVRALQPAQHAPCRTWTQDLYGRICHYLGAGHGFAGNASALIRGRALLSSPAIDGWQDAIVETAHATAMREGACANWPAQLEPPTAPPRLLVQWCHGAPGMITSLAALPDPRLDELLIAAGEMTWLAGPLTKGVGLCHGTDGNGYAFLKLFARTGNAMWLDRARAFAMHSIMQSEREAEKHGQRRYTLWTGDAGLACYLWSCIAGDAAMPNFDAIAPRAAPVR